MSVPVDTASDQATIDARRLLILHRINPLWERDAVPVLARGRVLRWLASQMGHEGEADTDSINLDQCRQAWVILTGVSYEAIRKWSTQHRGRKAPARVASVAEDRA